ncbi:hypothetical protein DERP_010752 [Dermatophagoides pteronyssinus]|uniref:Uncharacterized protein n=1 Tax=Dermatophagoides pteronyssinus TaxID=6956 RepID=A0ABQ8J6J2_DERPT|nr:hypothetical protein DERP_010752 [Dermatophagoides pteronyssinus]
MLNPKNRHMAILAIVLIIIVATILTPDNVEAAMMALMAKAQKKILIPLAIALTGSSSILKIFNSIHTICYCINHVPPIAVLIVLPTKRYVFVGPVSKNIADIIAVIADVNVNALDIAINVVLEKPSISKFGISTSTSSSIFSVLFIFLLKPGRINSNDLSRTHFRLHFFAISSLQ